MSTFAENLLQVFADMASTLSNQAIATDPALAARLATLHGRCVEFQCTSPPLTWHLIIHDNGIQTLHGAAEAPHAIVIGSGATLSAWAMANGNTAGLTIEGDESLVLQLTQIVKSFSPDLSGGLTNIFGAETAASVVGAAEMGLRGIQALVNGINETVQQRSADPFVNHNQLDTLLSGVDQLRLRVDRLAANVSLAEQRRSSPSA